MKHIIARIFASAALFAYMATPYLTHAQTTPPMTLESCTNLLLNGTMESNDSWTFDQRSVNAQYNNNGITGRAMLLSINPGLSLASLRWSSAIQKVALPVGGRAVLSFWYQLQRSADAATSEQVMLLDDKGEVLAVLFTNATPTTTWQHFTADLSAYAGRSIQILAAVTANDNTSVTSLLIDNLTLCDPSSNPLPPVAPEATATPQASTGAAKPTPTSAATADEPTPAPTPQPVGAPAPTLPSPPPASAANTVITFNELQVQSLGLISPLGTEVIRFRLPSGWELQSGAALQLDLLVSLADRLNDEQFTNIGDARLGVQINGVDLTPIPLNQLGNSTATVLIPNAAFAAVDSSGQHQLRFTIIDGPQCLPRRQISVDISPTSHILLPHTDGTVNVALSQLPQPIIQGSFLPDNVAIVVVDKPTAGELRAALIAAAGLGQLSRGTAALSFTTAGRLTDEMRAANHLILIGTGANLATLGAPPIAQSDGARSDDGIVQLIVSPWNSSKAALIISGTSDSGVIKASQAFSSGALQPSSGENTAIISAVNTNTRSNRVDADRSFSALGYGAQTITGSGSQTLSYLFTVPAGETLNDDAYLSFVFNHAATIDYQRSATTVELNGQPIGNILLSETSTQISNLRVTIPKSSIRAGQNEIAITAKLQPQENCLATDDAGIWLTAWPESLLHLPLEPIQDTTTTVASLDSYPAPFAFNATLSTTAFIAPQNDPDAWAVAAAIAFDLGNQVQGGIINLNAGYDGALDENLLSNHSLIAVGRPSDLPMIMDIKQQLPLSFTADNTLTQEYGALVAYRLAEDADVGYLETIISPWNEDNMLLAVLGNTAIGVQQASETLIHTGARPQASGNLSVIHGGQVISGSMPDTAQAPTLNVPAPAPAIATASEFRRPSWIVPTIAGSIVLIFAILGFVVFTALRQRKVSR